MPRVTSSTNIWKTASVVILGTIQREGYLLNLDLKRPGVLETRLPWTYPYTHFKLTLSGITIVTSSAHLTVFASGVVLTVQTLSSLWMAVGSVMAITAARSAQRESPVPGGTKIALSSPCLDSTSTLSSLSVTEVVRGPDTITVAAYWTLEGKI